MALIVDGEAHGQRTQWVPPVAHGGRGLGRAVGLVLATVLILTTIAFAWRATTVGTAAPAAGASPDTTITLAPREFVRTLRVTGLTEATKSYVVTVPLQTGGGGQSLVITHLASPGGRVVRGDVIVEFDRQNQDKVAFDKAAEYHGLVEQIAKKRAEHDAARVKDDSEREQASNRVAHFELEALKNEMLSAILAEKNTQDLEEARQRLAALRASYPLKRQAAVAEIRVLEITRDRAKAAMEHAERNAAALTIRSPIDGVVVPRTTWKGSGPGDIQEGDQLWPGAPVLEVVNPASMQVRARVNQADLHHVHAGQPVIVRLDAYPDLALPGHVAQVAPIALPGSFSSRVRSFTATIAIDGSTDRLLPDLTAAVDVELDRVRNALVVPRDAVQADDKGHHRVRVSQPGGTVVREVALGPGDDVDVVVTGGLRAGDVVLR